MRSFFRENPASGTVVLRHGQRGVYRHNQAAGIGFAAAGQRERGAVIHRGAHKRQPQGDVDAFAEAGLFQHRQALVVIHGQHGIGALQHKGLKERVGRIGAVDIHAAGTQCFQRGDDDVDFFAP